MPKPRKKQVSARTNSDNRQHWMVPFLLSLSKTSNVGEACEKAGVGRNTVYDYRKKDADFAAKWDEAIEMALDRLEKKAWTVAMRPLEPDPSMIRWLLSRLRPAVYGDKSKGMIVGPVFLLRGAGGDRQITTLADLQNLSTEELEILAGDSIEIEQGDYRLLTDGKEQQV